MKILTKILDRLTLVKHVIVTQDTADNDVEAIRSKGKLV